MANQNKNLNIKLQFDVDSSKVVGSFEEINQSIEKVKGTSEAFFAIEKEREAIHKQASVAIASLEGQKQAEIKGLISSYTTVKDKVTALNIEIANGTKTVEQATAILKAQVEEENKINKARLANVAATIKNIEAKKEEWALGIKIKEEALFASAGYDAAYHNILKANEALKQQEQEQIKLQKIAADEKVSGRANTFEEALKKAEAKSKESFAIQNAIALEGENSITAIKLKAKQQQLQIETDFNTRIAKLGQDFANSEKNWTSPSAQVTQAIRARDEATIKLNADTAQQIELAKQANKEASKGNTKTTTTVTIDATQVVEAKAQVQLAADTISLHLSRIKREYAQARAEFNNPIKVKVEAYKQSIQNAIAVSTTNLIKEESVASDSEAKFVATTQQVYRLIDAFGAFKTKMADTSVNISQTTKLVLQGSEALKLMEVELRSLQKDLGASANTDAGFIKAKNAASQLREEVEKLKKSSDFSLATNTMTKGLEEAARATSTKISQPESKPVYASSAGMNTSSIPRLTAKEKELIGTKEYNRLIQEEEKQAGDKRLQSYVELEEKLLNAVRLKQSEFSALKVSIPSISFKQNAPDITGGMAAFVKQEQETLRANLEKQKALVQEANDKINTFYKDAAEKRKFIAQAEATSRLTIYADLFRELERTEQIAAGRASRTDMLSARFKQETAVMLDEMNNRLTLEQAVRVNGANSIQVLQIKAGQEEVAIRKRITAELLAIENDFKNKTFASIKEQYEARKLANQQRTTVITSGASDLTANKQTVEKATVNTGRITALREESRLMQTEFQKELQTEAIVLQYGVNSKQAIENRGANARLAAEKEYNDKVNAIHKQYVNDVTTDATIVNALYDTEARKYQSKVQSIVTSTRQEINAIKATEEARKQELSTFDRVITEEQARLSSSIAIEQAIRINGINSSQVARLRSNEQIRQAEIKLQADLASIRTNVRTGGIGSSAGISQAAIAQNEYRTAVNAATSSLTAQERAAARAEETHKSLFSRVGAGVFAYRAWNTALTTVKDTLISVPKVGIELESTQASLTATTGSAAGMNSVMLTLEEEANRTGIAIGTLRETFRGFQASTSLAGESMASTWKMFSNLNTVITGLHLPADKASGIFLAMAQIFNKGKVQSEELVKQLGNLLPGAFASFAEANNKAFGGQFENSIDLISQMKKGMVFAHDTVERFTEFMAKRFEPAFALASHGLNASIGRLQTSFTLLREAIYTKFSSSLVDIIERITILVDTLKDGVTGTNQLGNAVIALSKFALIPLSVITANYIKTSITAAATTIRQAEAMAALGASTTAVSAGMTRYAAVNTMLAGTSVAAGAALIAVNALRNAFLFLISPTGIIAGIFAIYTAITELDRTSKESLNTVKDLVEKSRENLDKLNKPVLLSMSTNFDPAVMEAKKAMDNLQVDVDKAKKNLEKNWFFRSVFEVDIEEGEKNLKEVGGVLANLKEAAKIKIQMDNAEALIKVTDAADKLKAMLLDAKGFKLEAQQLQFEIKNKADVKEALAFVNKAEGKVNKAPDTTDLPNTVLGNIKVPEIRPKITFDKAGAASTERQIDEWRETVRKGVTPLITVETVNNAKALLDQYNKSQEVISTATELQQVEGHKAQLEDQDSFNAALLTSHKNALENSKDVNEVAMAKEAESRRNNLKVLERLKLEEDRINLRTKDNTGLPDDSNTLKVIAKARLDLEAGVQSDVQKARDDFYKKQQSALKSSNSGLDKLHKAEYRDIERNAELINNTTDAKLAAEDSRYARHLVNIGEHFATKKKIQEDNIRDLQANYQKEYQLARKYGDVTTMEKAKDKMDNLQPKMDTISSKIEQDKAAATQDLNDKIAETNKRYLELTSTTEAAARASFELSKTQGTIAQLLNASNDSSSSEEERAKAKLAYQRELAYETITLNDKINASAAEYKSRVDAIKLAYIDLNTQTSSSLSQSLGAFAPVVSQIDQMTASTANLTIEIENMGKKISDLQDKKMTIEVIPQNFDQIAQIDKQIELSKQEQQVSQDKLFRSQVKGAGDTFSAIEKMTNKHSALNKAAHAAQMVMNGIEFAFKLKDMALTIASFTTGFALKAKDMAMNIAALPSALALGAAQMFAQSGWAGFAGVAAMLALIAAIGMAVAGGSSGPKVTDTSTPVTSDTGTVLGDKEAKSTSLENSMSLLVDINYKNYQELAKINRTLLNTANVTNRIINTGVQGNLLGKTPDLTKSGIGTNAAKVAAIGVKAISTVITAINITESIVNAVMGLMAFNPVGILLAGLAQIPAIGKIINKVINFFAEGLFGKVSIKKIDEGLMIRARSARALLTGSQAVVDQYTTLQETTESWFDKSVKIYDVFQKATDNTVKLFTNLYFNIATSVKNLAVAISKSATDAVYLYKFQEVKISLSGKTGKQITEKLKALINKQLDKMSTAVFGQVFGAFQQVGEGMFQTVNRLYTQEVVAKKAIEDIGGTFEPNTQKGILLADALIQVSSNADTAAGRLKEFAQQEAEFTKNFLTTNKKNTLAVQNFADSVASIFQSGLTKEQVGASQTFTEKQVSLAKATTNESIATQVESKAWDKYSAAFDKNWVGKLSDAALKPIYDTWVVTRKSLDKAKEDVKTATDNLVPVSTITDAKTLKQVFFESVKTTGDFGSAIVEMKKSLDTTTDSGKQTYAMLNALDTTFTSLTTDILKPIDDQINTIKDSIDARTVEQKMAALASSKDINEQRKLTTSLQKQITAKYDTEKSAINNIKNSFIKLADTVKSLLLSDLSTLDPYAKFKEAQKEYDLTLEQTKSADLAVASEAAGKLGTVAQTYLKEAQSYFGATEAYANIFKSVTGTLSDLSTTATNQADAATEAVTTLGEAAIKQLEELSTGFIKSVSEALQDLVAKSTVTLDTNSATDMLAKLTTSANNLGQSFDTLITKFNTMMSITPTKDKSNMQVLTEQLAAATTKSQSTDKAIKAVGKQEVTNINEQINSYAKGFKKGGVDLAELYSQNRKDIQTYTTTIATEKDIIAANKKLKAGDPNKLTADQLLEHQTMLQEAQIAKAAIINVGAFANGGTASGMTLVGERGPELLRLPRNTQVINNNNTNSLLENINKHSDTVLVNVLKELKYISSLTAKKDFNINTKALTNLSTSINTTTTNINKSSLSQLNKLIDVQKDYTVKKDYTIKKDSNVTINKPTKLESNLQSMTLIKKDYTEKKQAQEQVGDNESLIVLTDMRKELIILNERMATIERKTRLSKTTMSIA